MEEIEVRNVSKDFLDASGKPFHAIRVLPGKAVVEKAQWPAS